MKQKFQIPILFFAVFLSSAAASCNRSCGGWTLPFPFGVSTGCQIQLNCSADGAASLAAGFPVQSITSDTILINLPAACGRSVEELRRLFTRNYSPTVLNAILLQNCTGRPTSCFLPETMVTANFRLINCDGGGGGGGWRSGNISCYSESQNRSGAAGFIDFERMMRSGCRFLLSAISSESFPVGNTPVSLDVKTVRMAWWVLGDCRCSPNARCVRVTTPLEANPAAYRCECLDGFVGDGFHGGIGCRKESQRCNPSKYISGHCGRTARVVLLATGAVVGASLIACFTLLLYFIRTQSNRSNRSKKMRQLCNTTGITVPIYPYKKLSKATDNFSDKRRVGNGAYGTVFSGKMSNNNWVAVKRIKHRDDATSIQQVINEIKLLTSVDHPNLVKLLGCCIDPQEQILVYEFMPNGTLFQHLQRERGDGIPWQARLTIATETAHALAYLHNTMQPPIYHRDVKSDNILLDYEYGSKVADFGLSRVGANELSHVSTAPQGTPGYLDPQYHQDFQVSDKSDVYSFGVVLAEIITGLKALDFSRDANEVNLTALAVDRIGTGRVEEMIDPFVLEYDVDHRLQTVSSVQKVAELAFRCLAFARDSRPCMCEVAGELAKIRDWNWDETKSSSSCSNSD